MSAEVLDPQMGPRRAYFKPNSWAQERALISTAPEVLYSGRYGSSKTRTLTQKLDLRCRKHAGARCVFSRKRRVDLGATSLPILLDKTITPSMKATGWRRSSEGGATLHYPNGSSILCVGFDEPGKLKSGEFDLVCIDQGEEIDEEEYTSVLGRLRNAPRDYVAPDGRIERAARQVELAVNPASPAHFLFKRFNPTRSHVLRTKEPLVLADHSILPSGSVWAETIMAGGQDNMENLTRDYLARLAMFKGIYRDRYVLGVWRAFEGAIFDCWDGDLHVTQRPRLWKEKWRGLPPPDWPIWCAIDFGYVNPFVCQWWAQDPDGDDWLFREVYMSKRTINDHARLINRIEEEHLQSLRECESVNALTENRPSTEIEFLPIYARYADHDAGERAVLEDEFGIVTEPADKDVSAGLQSVYERMVPFDVDGSRRTRLHFIADALVEADESLSHNSKPLCTIDEIPAYRYRAFRESIASGTPREEPFKEDDHGCDAMRMLLHSRKQQSMSLTLL